MKAWFTLFFSIVLLTGAFGQQLEPPASGVDICSKAKTQYYESLKKLMATAPQGFEDYDAQYYRIEITIREKGDTFSGVMTGRFRIVKDGVTEIVLHFGESGTVSDITSGGKSLAFTHNGDLLTVDLGRSYAQDELVTLMIKYDFPIKGSAFIKRTRPNVELGRDITTIATQSEPFDARNWWPCKDAPSDKADSVDVLITTDTTLFPVSNGTLVSDLANRNGTHTVHWAERYPIVTYLVSVAAATYNHNPYMFYYGADSMRVDSWYYERSADVQKGMDQVMLNGLKVYSDLLIPYPFMKEKYGMAEYEWGGAMEHQTVSSMGFYGTGVVVHELAHQWFGDKVTCASFKDIWLNEGWATYMESLYYEQVNGVNRMKADMAAKMYFGPGTITVEDPANQQIFSGNLSYRKASWVLHMMRHIVGDSAFFSGVRKYLGGTERETYRSVTTDEFVGYLERESGYDFDTFIQNWIYGEYYPTYKYDWTASRDQNMYKVEVNITQMFVPKRQIFDLPIDLTLRLPSGDTTFVVRNNTENASYTFFVSEEPTDVLLDKDNWILKKVLVPMQNPTFDKGILLVNGVDWNVSAYAQDLLSAYEDSIFTGVQPFDFWDLFNGPRNGYPQSLPKPLGKGAAVPPDVMGQYCTVVWIGNDYNGDLAKWSGSPIWSYLQAGGNVILISRSGINFLDDLMMQFLGITWNSGLYNTITDCTAMQPGLVDMAFTGQQNLCPTFATTLSRPDNEILFTDNSTGTPRGIGVLGKPLSREGGLTGAMIFLGMRPYRVEHQDLRRNMETLLGKLTCATTAVEQTPSAGSFVLGQSFPNPVSTRAVIPFHVDGGSANVTLKVFDLFGREVATVFDGPARSGDNVGVLDVSRLRPGMYFYQLKTRDRIARKTMMVVR
ncbi:MAG: T9SS type A sorting domain-containing protein [Chlorobi bacterium]|nr:T9SS type A sorting domain-containing protein [Chlorobiota bacterium]